MNEDPPLRSYDAPGSPLAHKRPRRTFLRAAWTLALVLVAILGLKTFVCDVRHVESASMEPTILGSPEHGESVLVEYSHAKPERFDLVVFRREGETAPIVKRVVGLPGESVRIANGDLFVNGARLPPDAPRPPPILVFDDRFQKMEEWFQIPADWKRHGEMWVTDTPQSFLAMRRALNDDYFGPDHAFVHGDQQVNDAIIELEVWLSLRACAVVELTEQGDTFRFVYENVGSNDVLRILRVSEDGQVDQLGADMPYTPESPPRLRCSNVDNEISIDFDDGREGVHRRFAYAENRFHKADSLKEGRSYTPRIRIGAERGDVRFRSIRILRDVYWTPRGTHGVGTAQDLGPDELFVLGDNSAESRDSREWGPIRLDQVFGKPVWVVWPLSHLRRLEPRVAPGGGR